ncbi:MAG: helix-turn-helix domain-containing protein [Defluviitaleaceae bacterium]|nr:helix-turn-helix domain-containing protein [Defluviitaleaceae bacterium]
MLKFKLLDEVFEMGGNHNADKNEEIKAKLLDYLKTNGIDAQIEDGLRLLEAYSVENKDNDFEAGCEIVAPIFERLSNINEWHFYDIRLIAAVLNSTYTAEQAYELAEKALKKLEDHSYEKRYKGVKLSIYINTQSRLLRAKYFDSDNLIPSDELAKRFSNCYRAITDICGGKRTLGMPRAIATIRYGFFYGDAEAQRAGFSGLARYGTDEVYKMMEADAKQFEGLVEVNLSKRQLDKAIGANIRRIRKEAGYSTAEIAAIVGYVSTYINQMENGSSGISAQNIYKVANALKVPIDALYEGVGTNKPVSYESTMRNKSMEKIRLVADRLTDSELEYIASVAELLPNARIQLPSKAEDD